MTDLIYSAVGGFTSVRDPYMDDNFVARMFKPGGDAATARQRFEAFLKDRPLLPALIAGIADERAAMGDGAPAIPVVDCGVFMGNFAIAAALQAARIGQSVAISAYEANPVLAGPIRANLALYGLEDVAVHANGIGGSYGTLRFTHRAGGLIGGTLFMPDRKATEAGATSVDCEVVPLRDVLLPELAPGLVKIDIEGNEVAAFGSIAGDPGRLNNVYFIEFAPFQAALRIAGGSYGDFLLQNFAIFDVGSWLYGRAPRRLDSIAALEGCLEHATSRAHNTDLLAIPQGMTALAATMAALAAG